MRYVPDAAGFFAGQMGYGYRSIEAFIDAAAAVRGGESAAAAAARAGLATFDTTMAQTAILEAGRRSLDAGGRPVRILYAGERAREGAAVDVDAVPTGFDV
jgi:D-galacturonate reductase